MPRLRLSFVYDTILFHGTCKSQQLNILSIRLDPTSCYIAMHIAIPEATKYAEATPLILASYYSVSTHIQKSTAQHLVNTPGPHQLLHRDAHCNTGFLFKQHIRASGSVSFYNPCNLTICFIEIPI